MIEGLSRSGEIDLEALIDAHRSPLVWIIGTAPLFLGLLARAAGRQHDLLLASERARQEGWLRDAGELAASAQQQAAAVEETTASASAVARISAQTEERARAVIAHTRRSEELSRAGRASVDEAIAGIDRLNASVAAIAEATGGLAADAARIGEIIEAVKELAAQSKLLALNASIEASRAGHHGAGFRVVASEMRKLSERSHDAAEQVRKLLEGVLASANGATSAAGDAARSATDAIAISRRAASAIQGLADVVIESAAAGRVIVESSRQQRDAMDQIVATMGELSTAAASTASEAAGIEAAASALVGSTGGSDAAAPPGRVPKLRVAGSNPVSRSSSEGRNP
jgi:methyl-accepting chemotaxis protein